MKELSDEQKKILQGIPEDDVKTIMSAIKEINEVETDNLILTHFSYSQASDFYKEVIMDKEAIRYSCLDFLKEIESCEDWLNKVLYDLGSWVLIKKDSKELFGFIKIENDYSNLMICSCSLSWLTKKDFSETDLVVEAIKALSKEHLRNHIFFKSHYELIEIKINANQPNAAEICSKAGFTKEGSLRNRCLDYLTGEKSNMEIWSLLREEV